MEHLQRLHGSATKLMVMRVVPDRPMSGDSAAKAWQSYMKDIDFYSSTMHAEALEQREQQAKRKMMTRRTRTLD